MHLQIAWFLLLSQQWPLCMADWYNELFGDGDFSPSQKKDIRMHLSSSTEDLMLLFEAEKEAILQMKSREMSNAKENELVTNYLKRVDFDPTVEASSYVFHPINAYHMVQRIAQRMPQLVKLKLCQFKYILPTIADANYGATNGLVDIHEYFGVTPSQILSGRIKDELSGKVYVSGSNITSAEAIKIATAARDADYLDGFVAWCKSALDSAKIEGREEKFLAYIKKLIRQAKAEHDDHFYGVDFNAFMDQLKRINDAPYYSSSGAGEKSVEFKERSVHMNSIFDNILQPGSLWDGNDLTNRMTFFLRKRVQKLCTGTYQRPAHLDRHLRCHWLDHNQPYLKLGPFKYEMVHGGPEVAIIHDMASQTETRRIREIARGRMKSTPYAVGDKELSFSKLRTSKVMYINERNVKAAMALSKRIEMITRYKLTHERYASENFQVMNYGIGGKISGHLDSKGGNTIHTTEELELGGLRVTTFMIYLTSVEAGGRTIFPQAGISVPPVEGSALFWFNVGPQENFDSRIFHLGCPVIHGNKWIANKWVKWLPQFHEYPCLISQTHYSTRKKDGTQ